MPECLSARGYCHILNVIIRSMDSDQKSVVRNIVVIRQWYGWRVMVGLCYEKVILVHNLFLRVNLLVSISWSGFLASSWDTYYGILIVCHERNVFPQVFHTDI